MPDFLRWIFLGITSIIIAGGVFILATVGIVVAFIVFLISFVVLSLTMRRRRNSGVHFTKNGHHVIFYSELPKKRTNSPSGETPSCSSEAPGNDIAYDLHPDDYTVKEQNTSSDPEKRPLP